MAKRFVRQRGNCIRARKDTQVVKMWIAVQQQDVQSAMRSMKPESVRGYSFYDIDRNETPSAAHDKQFSSSNYLKVMQCTMKKL